MSKRNKGASTRQQWVFPRALEMHYRDQQSAWGFAQLQSQDAQLSW